MPDLTPTQLQRIRDGATLVATPARDRTPEIPHRLSLGKPSFVEGQPIDPTLPGYTWGKSRAVRRVDVTMEEFEACYAQNDHILPLRKVPELGDAEFVWLTEVRGPEGGARSGDDSR